MAAVNGRGTQKRRRLETARGLNGNVGESDAGGDRTGRAWALWGGDDSIGHEWGERASERASDGVKDDEQQSQDAGETAWEGWTEWRSGAARDGGRGQRPTRRRTGSLGRLRREQKKARGLTASAKGKHAYSKQEW